MTNGNDPYRPPGVPPSSLGLDSDKHVANGCAIFGMALVGVGAISFVFAVIVMAKFFGGTNPAEMRSDSGEFGVLFLGLFGITCLASGVLAYRMQHVWSILFFAAGLVLLFVLFSSG